MGISSVATLTIGDALAVMSLVDITVLEIKSGKDDPRLYIHSKTVVRESISTFSVRGACRDDIERD